MKNKLNNRALRWFNLPTVLLMLAFGSSFASVGHSQDIPQTTVTVKESPSCSQNLSMRDEMQTKARRAIWDTRISIATDLHARLYRQHSRSFMVAGTNTGKRG